MGLAVALVSIVTLFVTFSAVFLMRQATGVWDPQTSAYVRDWQPLKPPFRLLMLNTLLLLASSVTVELARRRAAERALLAPLLAIPGIAEDRGRPVPWLELTAALGLAFLILQGFAWHILGARGWQMSSGPSSSFFYILTGTHAAHLIGGLLALLYAAAAAPLLHKGAEARRIMVDVAAWYWHVMAVLWIYIFALLIYVG